MGFDDALELALEQGVTKLHVVRTSGPEGWRRWTAIVQRGGGAHAATGHGDTFEDAIVSALMDVGVQW